MLRFDVGGVRLSERRGTYPWIGIWFGAVLDLQVVVWFDVGGVRLNERTSECLTRSVLAFHVVVLFDLVGVRLRDRKMNVWLA